jgi:tRNA(fMet)-specific endonuclease VapC
MKYLLDTSVCVGLLRGTAPKTRARFERTGSGDCVLCSIVLFELHAGALKSARPGAETEKVNYFIREFVSLEFDNDCAIHAARARMFLERLGLPIGGFDLLIGAISLRHSLCVVSRNTSEFDRIPGLKVEDWEA